jgi:hypothetical protein
MWDHYDGENVDDEENLNEEFPASQDCTVTGAASSFLPSFP